MKKLAKIIKTLIMSILPSLAIAQQDPQFTQFVFNKLYFNPAFAGAEKETQYTFVYRNQWTGYQPSFGGGGAPGTFVANFNTALPGINSGIGAHLVSDQLGPVTNLELQLSYAYHVSIGRNATLSFGARAGGYMRRIDYDLYRAREPDELIKNNGVDSNLKPDFAAGVYYKSQKAFLGLSLNHLNQTSFDFGVKTEGLVNNANLMGGYEVLNTERLIVMPNFMVRSSKFSQFSFDIGALTTYKANNDRQFWAGISYRDKESANAIIGVTLPGKTKKNISRNLKIGYSFDYVFVGQAAKQPTSHEIVIAYSLPVKMPIPLPTIRTPRFRFN